MKILKIAFIGLFLSLVNKANAVTNKKNLFSGGIYLPNKQKRISMVAEPTEAIKPGFLQLKSNGKRFYEYITNNNDSHYYSLDDDEEDEIPPPQIKINLIKGSKTISSSNVNPTESIDISLDGKERKGTFSSEDPQKATSDAQAEPVNKLIVEDLKEDSRGYLFGSALPQPPIIVDAVGTVVI
jgi:hypothetical protein